jgi:hypothetical protein
MKIEIRMIRDAIAGSLLTGLSIVACAAGTAQEEGASDNKSSSTGGGGASAGAGGSTSNGSGGGLDISAGVGPGSSSSGFGCTTTLSGTVFDPSGKLPLYNVVVYVPSEPMSPIPEGAACETCDGNFSGKPVAAALSDENGKFSMDITKVPAGGEVPVVVQVGKWRREITVPAVKACGDTVVSADLTRLPRNKKEGNMPHIAIARGGSDALECLIRKLGVEDAEFTTDKGDGRVHLYYDPEGTAKDGTGKMASGEALTTSDVLFSSLPKMKEYDIVLMACQGSGQAVGENPLEQHLNVRAYADQGGRIFGSHYNSRWIWWDKYTKANPYPSVVQFASSNHGFVEGEAAMGAINTTFAKGKALSNWLVNVGASAVPGQVPIIDGEHTVDAVVHPNAQEWISIPKDNKSHANVVQYFSFPTPIEGEACGRMVFSDLHVASGTGDSGKVAFPTGCVSKELSPQEKALAFMFFDLASCVQAETEEPPPPILY